MKRNKHAKNKEQNYKRWKTSQKQPTTQFFMKEALNF